MKEEQGSFLIELSILLPLIIAIVLFLLLVILHMHDRNLAKLSIEHFSQGGQIELKSMSTVNLAQINDLQFGENMVKEGQIQDSLKKNLLIKGTQLTFHKEDEWIECSLGVSTRFIFFDSFYEKVKRGIKVSYHDRLRKIEVAEYVIEQYEFTNKVKTAYEKNLRKLLDAFKKYMN